MVSPQPMLKNLHSEYSRWDADEVKVFFENEGVDLTSLLSEVSESDGMSASAVLLMQYFYLVRCLLSSYLCWGAHLIRCRHPQRLCVLLVPGLQQALPTVSDCVLRVVVFPV